MQSATRMRAIGISLTAVAVLAAATLMAQEATTKDSSKSDAAAARRRPDPSGRVPNYFGQIGLTSEQRETIYKIQGKHQRKIDELEKQIDEIQAQMLGECEGVLTDTQKQM